MEERILSLRKLLDLSQKEFASKIFITQAALSQIESGKTNLSTSTVYNLIEAFELRSDWLLFGTGEIFAHQTIETAKGTPLKPQKIYDQLIPFVNKDAEAGYLDNFEDSEFIKTLGAYRIPGYDDGIFRMFNVSGDSMIPSLYENEIVITQAVDDITNLQNNRLCVIITQDGIVVKRIFQEEKHTMLLKSDNPKYKSYKLAYNDIIEVWEIKGKISSEFLNEALPAQDHEENSMAKRLTELEKTVRQLKSAIHLDGHAMDGNGMESKSKSAK
ncbi:XRE family transcriptional regulator [Catalinimonas niigatensis]|uniref:XRE family transcriptional regulator n=1 Tax=Catalinimonas niigatensis TaxID=1397264 RepID=UPI00266675D1|nr:LexA family transcriptional regulator [Catalinimonas niigatensis]WPP48287.1 LexA family transcriptional regulator [Catalinimonas niigatensis]